ncbi:MAG TPA: glutathione S-transferase family protein [Solirubrobacteraceae bacterium]|jgi:glutathione S-transferase|nr:glutathione S-transferase family protein [Solirubrobacteraceae bacterium]
MPARLYSLALSHPALCARCMLEHKGIEHRVVNLVPGTQVVLRAMGFPGYTVPALVLENGRRLQRTRVISRALDELVPDPPLFPRDPEARRRVEDAERWGDEVLQGVPRRIFQWSASHDYSIRRWLAVDVSRAPAGALLALPSLQAKAFARASGANDPTVRADLAALPSHLAEVERLRGEGVIGGDERNAADFQIASSLRNIANFEDLAPYVEDHPAIRWAATVVPPLPGPIPRALPRQWLAPLEPLVAAAGAAR